MCMWGLYTTGSSSSGSQSLNGSDESDTGVIGGTSSSSMSALSASVTTSGLYVSELPSWSTSLCVPTLVDAPPCV